jgi:hypothetical protein
MMKTARNSLRYVAQGFSCILMLLAIWLLLAEISRAALPHFPPDGNVASLIASERNYAKWAARFGIIRGDLWTESALTYADLMWPAEHSDAVKLSGTLEEARSTAERALRYAPHDARAWLLLAALDSRTDSRPVGSTDALKISYYTDPNEADLTPLRLSLSLQPDFFADEEIRELAGREIRLVTLHRPELRAVLAAAYRDAAPPVKRFIEESVQDLDPEFLTALRTGTPVQPR